MLTHSQLEYPFYITLWYMDESFRFDTSLHLRYSYLHKCIASCVNFLLFTISFYFYKLAHVERVLYAQGFFLHLQTGKHQKIWFTIMGVSSMYNGCFDSKRKKQTEITSLYILAEFLTLSCIVSDRGILTINLLLCS